MLIHLMIDSVCVASVIRYTHLKQVIPVDVTCKFRNPIMYILSERIANKCQILINLPVFGLCWKWVSV